MSGLSTQALLSVAEEFALIKGDIWDKRKARVFTQWLNRHDIGNRPLYAMIFAEYPNSENPEELLRSVLQKEAGRRSSLVDQHVDSRKIENLLFLTTVVGGLLPKENNFDFIKDSELADLFPNISTLDTEQFCSFAGSSPDINRLPGLEPDLLGERFVLDLLAKKGIEGANFKRILHAAYRFQPDGVLSFAIKLFFDFSDDDSFHEFFKLPTDSSELRVTRAKLISQISGSVKIIWDKYLQLQLEETIQLANQYRDDIELQKYTALSEYNYGCGLMFSRSLPFPLNLMVDLDASKN